jgi:phosphatidylglycerol:prolipoprotein diacylglycerol transferase
MNSPSSYAYGWLMLAGIAVSAVFWARLARRDDRLLLVYVAALIGAFLGAKLAYLLAEGWRDLGQADVWLRLATGKSILGALPGGYAGVELAKRWVGYRGVTGDWFAAIAPIGVILGRIGCWRHGCCLGRVCEPAWFTARDATGFERWPAVPVEVLFNLSMLFGFLVLRHHGRLPGQHFHLYLIAYGGFRFAHEFLRETPRVVAGLSGYQFIALSVAAFGWWAFRKRQRGFVGGKRLPS